MVDFNKMLSPEGRERLARRKKEKERLRAMTNEDFLASVIHCYHNASITRVNGVGINGRGIDGPIYDTALIYFILPELIQRVGAKLEANGREIKCPMKGCTGYLDLP